MYFPDVIIKSSVSEIIVSFDVCVAGIIHQVSLYKHLKRVGKQ